MPFSATQDEIGPMTRTVEDAARMLEVMAGYDAGRSDHRVQRGPRPPSYTASLDSEGLKNARIGLLTDFIGRDAIHEPVNAVVEAGGREDDGDGRDGRSREHSRISRR